jgi:hypothetical protein
MQNQFHDRFKLFVASYAKGIGLDQLLREVEKWIKDEKVAPKSIGIEFLDDTKTLIMSIGYKDDEAYEVSLTTALIGKLDLNHLEEEEKEIGAAVLKLDNIICHELFVTDTGLLHMIFMCAK